MSKYSFSLAQILLSFFLGVFGNKISEIINISPAIVIVGTCLLIGLSMFLESFQHQTVKQQMESKESSGSTQPLFAFKLNRIISVFPVGMIFGALLALLAYILFPYPEFPKLSVRLFSGYEIPGIGPYFYECVAYVGGIVSLYIIASRKQDPAMSYAYGIGYSWGMSAAILSLDPYNSVWMTYIGWIITIVLTAIIVVQIKHAISKVIDGLVKERN